MMSCYYSLSALLLFMGVSIVMSWHGSVFDPNFNPDVVDYCILIPSESMMMKDLRSIYKQSEKSGNFHTADVSTVVGVSSRISMLSGSLSRYKYPETMWKCASDYADEPCDQSFVNIRKTYSMINRGGHGTTLTWQFNAAVMRAFKDTPQIASELLWGCKAGIPPPLFHSYGCVACMVSNGSVVVTLTVNRTSVRNPFPERFPTLPEPSTTQPTNFSQAAINTTLPSSSTVSYTVILNTTQSSSRNRTNTTGSTRAVPSSRKSGSLGRLELSIIALSVVVVIFSFSALSCVFYKRSSKYRVKVRPQFVHTDVEAAGSQL